MKILELALDGHNRCHFTLKIIEKERGKDRTIELPVKNAADGFAELSGNPKSPELKLGLELALVEQQSVHHPLPLI